MKPRFIRRDARWPHSRDGLCPYGAASPIKLPFFAASRLCVRPFQPTLGETPKLRTIFDLFDHTTDVGVFFAGSQDGETAGGIAPFDDFDGDMTHAPLVHGGAGWFVEINRVGARERPAVIVHLEVFAGFLNAEDRACRPARPVGGGAADLTAAERGAHCGGTSVFDVIILRMRVSSGADTLHTGSSDGFFVFGQLARGATGDTGQGENSEEWDVTHRVEIHGGVLSAEF